jgi:hypothetical protein
MQKRLRTPKRSGDFNQVAQQLVRESTKEREPEPAKVTRSEVSRVMAAMGRKGGKKGGKLRAERMTPEQRSDASAKAANARWHPTPP